MSPEAKALDDWFNSEEGRSCADMTTLEGGTLDYSQYLRNRLWLAFAAGMEAGKAVEWERNAWNRKLREAGIRK